MKGRRHHLIVLEPTGSTRDAEGRATTTYCQHPTRGHATVPDDRLRLDFAEQTGEVLDTEALIDKSIPLDRDYLVAVLGTGNTLLDGTYRVVGWRPNPWHNRVQLRRYEIT